MALSLGENRHQHVGAGDFFAPRRLHVDRGALDDALEAGGRLGLLPVLDDEVLEFRIDISGDIPAQDVDFDVAGLEHCRAVGIIDQGEKQVLQGGVFMPAFVRDRERLAECLF